MFYLAFAKVLTIVFANTGQPCDLPKASFFFLPPWWEYLGKGVNDTLNQCTPNFTFPGDILLVGLALLDMLLRIAGFAAVVSIMIAGLQYVFTGGNPEKAAGARKRVYNSLIGLAIALSATAAVAFIGNQLVK